MSEVIQALLYSIPVWLGAILITLAFERIKPFKRRPVNFASPQREAILSLCLVALTIVLWVLLKIFLTPIVRTFLLEEWPSYSLAHMALQFSVSGIGFVPFAVALLLRRQSLATIGFSRHNMRSSLLLGIILSALTVGVYVAVYGKLPQLLTASYSHLYYFLAMLSVGFTEEAIFRGHLQNRLTAWLGASRGWILTAIVFTLGHIGQSILGIVSVFVIGLIFGWIMWKTGNIFGLFIWHAFIDWVWILS